MRDIETREDIEQVVDSFYALALKDKLIKHFFLDVAQIDYDHHKVLIYDFWDSILLDSTKYKGNAMIKHIQLHQNSPMSTDHFDRWLWLWKKNINNSYQGPKADMAIQRARQIASLMQHKIQSTSGLNKT